MRTFNNDQMQAVSNLSTKFGFDVNLIQPDAIGATFLNLILPIDYLQPELKKIGLKLSVNFNDKCICIYL